MIHTKKQWTHIDSEWDKIKTILSFISDMSLLSPEVVNVFFSKNTYFKLFSKSLISCVDKNIPLTNQAKRYFYFLKRDIMKSTVFSSQEKIKIIQSFESTFLNNSQIVWETKERVHRVVNF